MNYKLITFKLTKNVNGKIHRKIFSKSLTKYDSDKNIKNKRNCYVSK